MALSSIGLAVLWLLTGLGLLLRLNALRNQRSMFASPVAIVFGSIVLLSLVAIFILTPLPWQRYYLPLAAPLALVYSLGLTSFVPLLHSLLPHSFWQGHHVG